MQKTVGMYIHIPFCKSKCAYCDFYSLAGRDSLMSDYQAALLRHLKETAPLVSDAVDSVYFGGGTPSYYGAERLIKLLNEVRKRFLLSRESEITVEANPDSVDYNMLKSLRRAGVNRLSLGMQSSCDARLTQLGRVHTFEQTIQAVDAAKKALIENISLDLMFGLPSQTLGDWDETLEKAVNLGPRHISCYALKLEEGTPLAFHRDSLSLPDDDLQADMYLHAVEKLERAGYRQYEISNFALPGYESRHNLKYWSLEPYVGLGASAHSDLGNRRFSYVRDVEEYINGILKNRTVIAESEAISQRERAGEYLMLGLRTVSGVDPEHYQSGYKMDFGPIEALLAGYRENGWAEPDENRWRLTPKGFLVSNRLIGQLLEAQAPIASGYQRYVRQRSSNVFEEGYCGTAQRG